MSTLAMALAAVMVAGSAPERVSAETAEAKEVLRFKGVWYGTLDDGGPAVANDGCLDCCTRGLALQFCLRCVDDGRGRFTVKLVGGVPCHGIYKLHGDSITLCFGEYGHGYPTCFRATKDYLLLTLRRVNPRKKPQSAQQPAG